jgi:hypothetical protein
MQPEVIQVNACAICHSSAQPAELDTNNNLLPVFDVRLGALPINGEERSRAAPLALTTGHVERPAGAIGLNTGSIDNRIDAPLN